jgi:hypothetical protein
MDRASKTPWYRRIMPLALALGLLLSAPLGADLFSTAAFAGKVDLAWDAVPDPDVIGYRVFIGTNPGTGDQGIFDVGKVTSWTLDDIPDCQDLYIGIKAVDAGGQESLGFASFVQGMPQPFVSRSTPANLVQGTEDEVVTVQGGNFNSDMQRTDVVFDDPDVRVISLDFISCNEVEMVLSVGPFLSLPGDPGYNGAGDTVEEVAPAEIGNRAVTLTVPDGQGELVQGEAPAAVAVDFLTTRVDIDGSGRVDGFDLARVAHAFGNSGTYDADSDLDGNKSVDGVDLTILADWFSMTPF